MKKLGELMMILDLHRQGVKIAVIARQVGVDRKTVRKYIARGVEVPTYGPRQPRERLLDPHIDYLRARLEAYRLRRHADLLPEHIRSNALITPPAPVEPRRRGRPPKNGGAAQTT